LSYGRKISSIMLLWCWFYHDIIKKSRFKL